MNTATKKENNVNEEIINISLNTWNDHNFYAKLQEKEYDGFESYVLESFLSKYKTAGDAFDALKQGNLQCKIQLNVL